MLALARGEGQSIIIDGNIEVKIVKWSRSSVRIAIQAPREVSVDRDEVWRKMHPGELSPLEKAEQERRERFARDQATGAAAGATLTAVQAPVAGKVVLAGVEAGAVVVEGTMLCQIDGGEGLREVRAPMRGAIAKIQVTEGQSVEQGYALFLLKAVS